MKNILKKASVCIFPTFAEAFPVSWLEAMAMEKPIVASNIGWGKEVLQDEKEGFLVHPTNHKVFADRINKIIQNTELQKSLGANAKKRILTDFEIKKIALQNLDYYQKIIDLNASN
jgi:glycosyltransferase involved in cell wall biosynthesis